jgi:ribose transport system permease protein
VKKLLGMTLLLLALMIAISVFDAKSFLSPGNLQNLLQRIGMLGIYTLGAGIVILSGGIDLSVGSVIGFVGVMVAMLVTRGVNAWVASALVIPVCVLLGMWHAFLIGRFKLQPFLATLTSLLLLRGLARGISGGASQTLGRGCEAFKQLGNGSFAWIPIPFWIVLGIALLLGFLMNFTVYGRYLYAIGRNEEAVRYSGIKVNRIQLLAYVICAVLAGIAGVVELSYIGEVQPASAGLMYEMWAIAGAVLGGCSLRGGEGSVIGVIIGVSLITVMRNGINLLGVNTEWEWAVIGVVILGGVIADAAYKLRAAKRVKA